MHPDKLPQAQNSAFASCRVHVGDPAGAELLGVSVVSKRTRAERAVRTQGSSRREIIPNRVVLMHVRY